jgi:hypothetical protein
MLDTQYALFQELDRRCVARGLDEKECRAAVQAKRAIIESGLNCENPVVREVLAGSTTFVATYDSFSRRFRGLRRFVPHRHDAALNERLWQLARIVPNVRHFTRRSIFATDNPVTCVLYSQICAFAVAMVWEHSIRADADGGVDVADDHLGLYLALACGFAGFVVGAAVMLKYRTRDPNVIHAREAAAYMDLNYGFFKTGDDAAWAECIRAQCGTVPANVVRHDEGA